MECSALVTEQKLYSTTPHLRLTRFWKGFIKYLMFLCHVFRHVLSEMLAVERREVVKVLEQVLDINQTRDPLQGLTASRHIVKPLDVPKDRSVARRLVVAFNVRRFHNNCVLQFSRYAINNSPTQIVSNTITKEHGKVKVFCCGMSRHHETPQGLWQHFLPSGPSGRRAFDLRAVRKALNRSNGSENRECETK